MICDFAETYHIFNYQGLPVKTVATLVFGLRDNSRTKMALMNQSVSLDTLLQASILDQLRLLVWTKSKDAQKGRNKPKSLYESLTSTKEKDKPMSFRSGKDFENYRKQILERENK